MHAFLIIGNSTEYIVQSTKDLAEKLKAKILEYPLAKIENVRNLNSLLRLSINEPTLIVSRDIHEATEEALNAFLKNLEEPQDNVYFALTAPSIRKVLPTIVSRCEIVKSTNLQIYKSTNEDEIEKFLGMTAGEKLAYIDKIKDRNKAIEFAESLVNFLHSGLHGNKVKYSVQAKNLEVISKTLTRLKANGNVNLQLTNFVIQYGD
jgi:DNA polymerase III delta prime subunit